MLAYKSVGDKNSNSSPVGLVENSAGGLSYQIDQWTKLRRFLILGSEAGSYYASPAKLTRENAAAVRQCVFDDGLRVVKEIVEVSKKGLAPKVEPCIFALALCMTYGSVDTKQAAGTAVESVCRTGTHILHFVSYIDSMRGYGRVVRNAIRSWYESKASSRDLAYQLVKYQGRDSWTHRDVLRLVHPKPRDGDGTESGTETDTHEQELYYWAVKGWPDVGVEPHPIDELKIVWAFERAKRLDVDKSDDVATLVRLITDYKLPREAVPTESLKLPVVWSALLGSGDMPMTAMIRNLATMTKVGLLTKTSPETKIVTDQLENTERLKAARVHPISLLSALKVYSSGEGVKSSAVWSPVSKIIDALDAAFYSSFGNVSPTGKNILLGVDVSGSMYGNSVSGIAGLDAATAAAALSLVTANVEKCLIMAFSHRLVPLHISQNERLDSVVQKMRAIPFGGTDCDLPIRFALDNNLDVDAFVTYTDSETWAGAGRPKLLQEYRRKRGIESKLIVQSFVSNNYSIADKADVNSLDVVGLDASSPQIVSDFILGNI